jgi:hypothetical protein
MSTTVYTPEGLFEFTSEPAIEALKLMKQIMAYSNPDILLEGTSDAGVNSTPDEIAWAAQRVGLYFKYFNSPFRFAKSWDDPNSGVGRCRNSRMARVERCSGRRDAFQVWSNKEKAAERSR